MAYYTFQLSRIEQGLCMKCAKPRGETGTKTLCRICADKLNKRTKERTQYCLKNNLCLYCRNPLPDSNPGTRCPPCAKKQNEATRKYRLRRKQEGKCVRCKYNGPLIEGKSCCKTCYFKKVSVSHFHTVGKWEELKKIWDKQDGICPYTGIQLRLGIDATLDHIHPTSRFPKLHANQDNWQWIYYRVNEMKHNMTPKEFIDFISNILQYLKVDGLPHEFVEENT